MPSLSCVDLINSGRDLALPFAISVIPASGSRAPVDLEVTRLFRLMPGNRLVGLTAWEGEPALLKLFFQPRHWQRHLGREQKGNRLLLEARVYTPHLLETGTTMDGKGAFLLTRFLQDADSLADLQERGVLSLNSTNLSLVEKVMAALSRCHEKGIWQKDIHLNNFLLHEGRIYFLDSADVNVETLHAALGEKQSLDNLAWFFAQFPVTEDKGIPALYQYYRQCRSARQIATSDDEFTALVQKVRRQRLAAFRKKLLRTTSAQIATKTSQLFLVADRQLPEDAVNQICSDPDSLLEAGTLIKAGNTCTVGRIQVQGQDKVLKRYNTKNLLHGLRRQFGTSRAQRSWCSAQLLGMLGVPTPRPLLMLELKRLRLFLGRAYYLADYVNGTNVMEQILRDPANTALQDAIMKEFEALFRHMQTYRFTHGDMKATNFIYHDNRLQVLDLDAMTWHHNDRDFRKAFTRDLARFVANWKGRDGMDHVAGRAHNVTSRFPGDR